MASGFTQDTLNRVMQAQRNERTEHLVYQGLAALERDPANRQILEQIALDELRHAHFWQQFSGQEVAPDRSRAWRYVMLARVLGLTFAIKLMEKGEEAAQAAYEAIAHEIPEAQQIVEEEDAHEEALIAMLDEERLRYVGSMVLGLSDALVELTGALAGFTLALGNTRLIGTAGLITGIAASLSMAASEFLSTESQTEVDLDPTRAALYTGAAYVVTVALLILPYLILSSYLAALGLTLVIALLIIVGFTYYVSVARELPFGQRFVRMAGITLGVAALSFGIGYLVRAVFGIEI